MTASRDERQAAVYSWVVSTFGLPNADVRERVLRFFEEAVELAQAERLPSETLAAILAHVYGKDPGDPAQEAGGVGTTLLAYCAAKGLSADTCERREFERVLAIDPEQFRRRHNLKAAAGIALPSEARKPRLCPQCNLGTVVEDGAWWWCSRRYTLGGSCDWMEKQ